jgi:hypothetical protein
LQNTYNVKKGFGKRKSAKAKSFLFLPKQKHRKDSTMLFNRASRNLFNNAFRRFKSTSARPTEELPTFALSAVGMTFGTYMCADFLSNFIQHPTQKVRRYSFF